MPTLKSEKASKDANYKFDIMENTIEEVKTKTLKVTEYTNMRLTINIQE